MANTVKLSSVCPAVYGITVRRYQQLAKDGLVPASVDGYIDFVTSTKALISYYQKLVQGAGSITLTEERARLTKVQADIATLDYEKELGNLLEKEEVIRTWAKMIQASRSRFLSIPVKLAPLCEGLSKNEIKKLLEDAVYEALNELAEMDIEGIDVIKVGANREKKDEGQEKVRQDEKNERKQEKKEKQKKCKGCGRLIDQRATYCRRCASKLREKEKKKNDGRRK